MTAFTNAITRRDHVDFIYRNEDGDLRIRKAPIEFISYHRKTECIPHMGEIRRTRSVSGVIEEGEFIRLRWSSWDARKSACAQDGPFVQHGITCLESDVGPMRRYMADKKVEIAKPRLAYIDIETDSRVPFIEKERARILCWTVVDGEDESLFWQGKLEYDTDEDEKRILDELWTLLEQYDLLVAWMSAFFGEFDFEVIRARTKAVGASEKHVERLLYLDHLKVFKRYNHAESGEEKASLKLNSIATALLGEGKDDFDASKTWESWAEGGEERERMFRYNVKDVLLMSRIEKKTGFIALFQTICDVCGVFCESRSLFPSVQMDAFMLRLGQERGVRFPTKYYDDEESKDEGKYGGAFVVEITDRGIVREVHVGDFKSMYPNIILSWNMSPETKCQVPVNGPIPQGVCRSPSTRVGFRTDVEGILPAAVRDMLRLREWWNGERSKRVPNTPEWHEADRRATAYKTAVNAFYGVTGCSFSRYYDRQVAESITQNGVWLIKATIKVAEERGWKIVYGDTDSIHVTGCTRSEFEAFTKWLNGTYYVQIVAETGATNHNTMAYEKQLARMVYLSKKKYIGRLRHYKGKEATADSEPIIAGLEYMRGDASASAREMQKLVIDMLMRECCEEPTAIEPLLDKWLNHMLNEPLNLDEVKLSRSLSQNLSEYVVKTKKDGSPGAMQPHLALARVLMERGLINTRRYRGKIDVPAGTRIEYVITNASADPTEAVWAEEWKGECDRQYYWTKATWPPTKRLVEAAFPAHDWSKYDVKPKGRSRGHRGIPAEQGSFLFDNDAGVRNAPLVVIKSSIGEGRISVPGRRGKRAAK